jgi:hypothetical protein
MFVAKEIFSNFFHNNDRKGHWNDDEPIFQAQSCRFQETLQKWVIDSHKLKEDNHSSGR